MSTQVREAIAAVARLEADGYGLPVCVRDAPGDGFVRATELHAPGPLLDACIEESAILGDVDHAHVGAQWWFERCAWLAAGVALGCALDSGLVPSLAPEHVMIDQQGGLPAGWAALADVPPACSDGDPAQLAATLRTQLEAHLAPLAASITGARLRPARALWWSAGDRAVQAALWVGAATDRHDDALALVAAMLGPDGALSVPVRVADTPDGRRDHMRRSCCLAHRTPAGTLCAGCPATHGLDRGRAALGRP